MEVKDSRVLWKLKVFLLLVMWILIGYSGYVAAVQCYVPARPRQTKTRRAAKVICLVTVGELLSH